MIRPIFAQSLRGDYKYSTRVGLQEGRYEGDLLRFDDGRVAGIVNDIDSAFEEGHLVRYLIGKEHSKGLSFFKVDPLNVPHNPVLWTLRKVGENNYSGAWSSMGFTPFSLELKIQSNLQALIDLRNNLSLSFLEEEYFEDILRGAESEGLTGSLQLESAQLEATRLKLGL